MPNQDIIKNAIADATKDLMRKKTIDRISVNEICDKITLNRRTFYRYFRDKYEVVEWIHYNDFLLNLERYEGWSLWDYMPLIAQILFNDRAYYINAFQYRGQNSFRSYCIRYLSEILRADYYSCFPSEELYNFYVEHECNTAFDYFVLQLKNDKSQSIDEFVEGFRRFFYKPSLVNCKLLEREPPKRERYMPYEPEEPSKK